VKSFGSKATGERLARMQASPRWMGEGFRNMHPIEAGLRDKQAPRPTISEFLYGSPRRTPSGPMPLEDPRAIWTRDTDTGLRATWMGHSSVLIEIDGWRVLTDPVWGPRASPSRLAGPKRFHPAPVALRALPELDVVVISHDHYDHLDYPTIRALARKGLPFVTSLGVGAHLESWGVSPERITELDWWQSYKLPGTDLSITAAPSQHFSGRGLRDRNATLWSSMAIQGTRHRVFFSGDTGLTSEYMQIRDRLGPFDLVMLEVGAFHPAWGDIHLGPENAIKAHTLLGGGAFLPVHWGTFSLALHDWDQPAEVLFSHATRDSLPLLMPRLGQPVEPVQSRILEPWWRAVDAGGFHRAKGQSATRSTEAERLPKSMPWPVD
jgi:L-ascorbate metabolism protein UlaG (beta-lactamase superfamily)